MKRDELDRRDFVKTGTVAAVAAGSSDVPTVQRSNVPRNSKIP